MSLISNTLPQVLRVTTSSEAVTVNETGCILVLPTLSRIGIFVAMYMEPCTPEQLDIIYAEININEESINNHVHTLMEWIETQPQLPKIKNEQWLKQFILRSKNDLEKTKTMINIYYKTREEMPELFECRDPCSEEIQIVKDVIITFPVPKLTPDGYRILINDIVPGPSVRLIDPDTLLQFYQMHSDLLLKTDVHRGVILVIDMTNSSFDYMKLSLMILRRALKMHMKLTPTRYHKIYLVNLMPFARPLLHIGKRLISRKIGDRIEIWNKPANELSTVLPNECLPKEFGGTLKSISELNEEWYQCMVNHREWFKNDIHSTGNEFLP